MHFNVLLGAAFTGLAAAHGSHGAGSGSYGEEARTDYVNWMTRHMAGTWTIAPNQELNRPIFL